MADVISETNAKLLGSISFANIGSIVGWVIFALLVAGGAIFGYLSWKNNKLFNKKVTICDIVGGYYQPIAKDTAKTVKVGTGGFEILFLKKAKIMRIGYGGRVGKRDYYFFIAPDGYWYNGMMSAGINAIDKNGGLIPIVTTNPSMRAQYTALEKQIETLHAEKKSFMDKYGNWVFSIGFVLIVGVLAWLIFKEFNTYMGGMASITDKVGQLLERAEAFLGSAEVASKGGTGLTPIS
jgi:hypothetical protein